MPRILIFGAGAIGQWVAARMAMGGADVTVLCRRAACDAIRTRGLRVREASGCMLEAPPVRAIEELDKTAKEPFDWIFVTVKAFDVAHVMEVLSTAGRLSSNTRVMGFQNGVGTEEVIAAAVGPDRSHVCVVTRSIALTDTPGEVVEATARGGLAIAPWSHEPDSTADSKGLLPDGLEAVLAKCGLEVSRFDDYRVAKWSKLLLNMTANAVCAIVDCSPGELYRSRKLFAVEHAAFLEAVEVMRAMGIRPADLPGYPASRLWKVMTGLPRRIARYILHYRVGTARGLKQPSLRLEMGRLRTQSEVTWLNGAIVEHARRHGLTAPANAFLVQTLQDILAERTPWETYRRRPERFIADYKRSLQKGVTTSSAMD